MENSKLIKHDDSNKPLMPLIPISLGELIDKITILEIKLDKLEGVALFNVRLEHAALSEILKNLALSVPSSICNDLKLVNEKLWQIEDRIRELERIGDYGEEFIECARLVYITNDKRAALKKQINISLGSYLVEEKSYSLYT